MAQLIPQSGRDETIVRRGSGVAFQYDFEGKCIVFHLSAMLNVTLGKETFIPKLTLFIQLEDGYAVDAALSPDTRKYLESLVFKQQHSPADQRELANDLEMKDPSSEV